ncbi:uncharacterized protein UV8b_07677 [Ustilaginoidea virens]|uniref:Uncharacterized protein n=2 Tax=Ustilaginoidea virens TaxID=1159556 RepID=A0A8E5ML12_USTVR|nr:uncharacterized protein UV8b_07677 [Ustilaginoidea virens]QUC23436.1 hypothetical protein UV8b_07677 [Ustilaginoidea virens]
MNKNDSHTYNFALQKYILLQEQHEELSNHLEQIRPRKSSFASTSTSSSAASSTSSSSPKRHHPFNDHKHGRTRTCYRHREMTAVDTLDTIIDEETIHEISVEEKRLFDVNESIKRALTELLNCDTVRGDNSMRMWAQARLMETEKELRSGRRRKSSPCME